jgi:ATP-dependent RNA helicase DeaD
MHAARIPSQDDVLQAFRRAGLASLSPLQSRLIPLVLKGRDVTVETRPGSGTTTGYVAPLLLGLRGAGPGPRALILVPTAQEVAKVTRAVTRFTRVIHDAPGFVPLGEIDDTRKEQHRLDSGAALVAGTTQRIIDHIRRGSLVLKDLLVMVVVEPGAEARADFIKDVQFIFAKLGERPQAILLSRSALTEEDELVRLLHHPLALGAEEKPAGAASGNRTVSLDGGNRTDCLMRVLLGMRLPASIVFHSPRSDARGLLDALRASGLRAASLGSIPPARQQSERRSTLLALSRNALDVVLVPLGSSLSDLDELIPPSAVYLDLPSGGGRGGAPKGPSVLALVDKGQERDLARLQEAIGVAFTKAELPGDDEVLSGAIDRTLRRMKEENPAELARVRAQIRRQVPLMQRPLFMAALLKSQLPGGAAAPKQKSQSVSPQAPAAVENMPPRGQRGRFGRNTPDARPPRSDSRPPRPEARPARSTESQKAPRIEPRPGVAYTQLFVSIGRNRRVFARDLTTLFTEKLQLADGDIGGVRVFDKYSFVDIVPARAEDAISQLTGIELKGRPITVNHAKKKEEKEQQ